MGFGPESSHRSVRNRPLIDLHISSIPLAYLCNSRVYLFKRGFLPGTRFCFALIQKSVPKMNAQRLNLIREVLASSPVASQDELRRKLRRRGVHVTQATLSRDIHQLRLSKGPGGYSLPNGHGTSTIAAAEDEDQPPSVNEMIDSFGLRVRQATNQVSSEPRWAARSRLRRPSTANSGRKLSAPSPEMTPF